MRLCFRTWVNMLVEHGECFHVQCEIQGCECDCDLSLFTPNFGVCELAHCGDRGDRSSFFAGNGYNPSTTVSSISLSTRMLLWSHETETLQVGVANHCVFFCNLFLKKGKTTSFSVIIQGCHSFIPQFHNCVHLADLLKLSNTSLANANMKGNKSWEDLKWSWH